MPSQLATIQQHVIGPLERQTSGAASDRLHRIVKRQRGDKAAQGDLIRAARGTIDQCAWLKFPSGSVQARPRRPRPLVWRSARIHSGPVSSGARRAASSRVLSTSASTRRPYPIGQSVMRAPLALASAKGKRPGRTGPGLLTNYCLSSSADQHRGRRSRRPFDTEGGDHTDQHQCRTSGKKASNTGERDVSTSSASAPKYIRNTMRR